MPSSIRDDLLRISGNNFYGEVINTLMISASGAEGIDLRNVRYVHIMEPYWHPVTWLSHMLDCQLYGLNAGGHHLTNALLHLANTLLLFGVLNRLFVHRSPVHSSFRSDREIRRGRM